MREIVSILRREWEREYTNLSRLKGIEHGKIFPTLRSKVLWYSGETSEQNFEWSFPLSIQFGKSTCGEW